MKGNATMIRRETYERALERAQLDSLHIVLTISRADGSKEFHVVNPKHASDPSAYYTVRQPAGAAFTTCNCTAGQQGVYCKHRAWVRASRIASQASERTAK